jgi:hypothetical protein
MTIIGISLVVLGVAGLIYRGITRTSGDDIVEAK